MHGAINTGDVMVCVDCYFAHHYGVVRAAVFADGTSILWDDEQNVPTGATLQWFAGESDTPSDREPLNKLDGLDLFDNTCSNHQGGHYEDDDPDDNPQYSTCEHCGSDSDEDGIDTFSSRSCSGCGSTLGGPRYRLHWEERP